MDFSGLYGIQAARTYLDIHPRSRMLVLESDNVIGGTWSSSKVPFSMKLLFSRRAESLQFQTNSGFDSHSNVSWKLFPDSIFHFFQVVTHTNSY